MWKNPERQIGFVQNLENRRNFVHRPKGRGVYVYHYKMLLRYNIPYKYIYICVAEVGTGFTSRKRRGLSIELETRGLI